MGWAGGLSAKWAGRVGLGYGILMPRYHNDGPSFHANYGLVAGQLGATLMEMYGGAAFVSEIHI